MVAILKWTLRGFLGVVGLVTLAVAWIYLLLDSSIPDYSATHAVEGIDGPVSIIRDQHAVPHIFGETDADVFFGLGFAHAQDRLFQMVLFRRAAQGRLAEVFGNRALLSDVHKRRLNIDTLSRTSLSAQDYETRVALDAYAKGVNAWLGVVDGSLLNRGAPEFHLFNFDIEPWTASDSIAILALQAIDLAPHADDEELRARALERIDSERLVDLMPEDPLPPLAFPYVGQDQEIAASDETGRWDSAEARDWTRFFAGDGGGASNVWAANPTRTVSGKSIVANDPHLRFSTPSIWMLARLELSTGPVIGGSIPGIPLIPVGRSRNLAWGMTYAYLDDQDLYIESVNPNDGREYLTPDGFKKFESRSEVVLVKDEEPVELELRWTDNGPVFPGESFALETFLPENHVVSLAWTLLTPQNTSMTSGIRLMKSRTIDEALEAGRWHKSPALNILLADQSEIAMQLIGTVPRRHAFHATQGRIPSEGWKAANRWQGEFPFDSNPRFRNPSDGVLANTNNKIVAEPYPRHISHFWGDTQRIRRLGELLDEQSAHTRETFRNMQLDTTSYPARTLIPLLGAEHWHMANYESDDPKEQIRNDAIKEVSAWKGTMDEHESAPLIYAAWISALQRLLISDELGNLANNFRRPDPVFLERVFKDIKSSPEQDQGASAWCDIQTTDIKESCSQIAILALDEALSQLRQQFGSNVREWRWGKVHQARHDHMVLGGSELFSLLFSIQQPTSGGNNTLNVGQMSGSDTNPFASWVGPGYRGIYDFSNLDSSLYVIATGQSGHPFSKHYDDLGALWRTGQYIPMSLDLDVLKTGMHTVTSLQPAGQ